MVCTPPDMACRTDANGWRFIASRPFGRAINKASSLSELAVYPRSAWHTADYESTLPETIHLLTY